MDIEIIKNYFLSAGASYRKSLDWQKEFLDNNGKPKIRRSGRFGVGILSAFLIGKEISIKTKKHKSPKGYKFSANLNTELINIIKKSNIIKGGTSIKIKIEEFKIEEFKKKGYKNYEWTKWYTLSKPEIKYILFGKEIKPYQNFNPDNNEFIPNEWNAIDSVGYDKILWTYDSNFSKTKFTCNGILIPQTHNSRNLNFNLIYSEPQISVFDSNAILPLTLDRNSVAENLSFRNDLLEDIYKDFIANLLMFNQNSYVEDNKWFLKNPKLNHPSTKNNNYSFSDTPYGFSQYSSNNYTLREFLNTILTCKKGYIINYNYFIQKLNEIKTLLIQFNSLPEEGFELDIQDRFIFFSENKLNSIPDYIDAIEAKTWNDENGISEPFNSRIYIKTEKYHYLFNSKTKRASTWLKNKCEFQSEKNGFTCLNLDNPEESLITDDFLNKNSTNLHFIREYKITCPYSGDPILNRLLEKYIGDNVIIPFSLEERKRKYPLAFLELERYMKKYSTVESSVPLVNTN